ncbi:12715_t:CDS:2 [Ambispora leptoticha]|uniref:12715_t:CDS:1 n=1 Tax=Ambispora leptoticha TaxID=144679 RepID=A0A9N8YUT1_9GLOM|nr:12715_t:CDS:2 [Ambispora leptoticha]
MNSTRNLFENQGHLGPNNNELSCNTLSFEPQKNLACRARSSQSAQILSYVKKWAESDDNYDSSQSSINYFSSNEKTSHLLDDQCIISECGNIAGKSINSPNCNLNTTKFGTDSHPATGRKGLPMFIRENDDDNSLSSNFTSNFSETSLNNHIGDSNLRDEKSNSILRGCFSKINEDDDSKRSIDLLVNKISHENINNGNHENNQITIQPNPRDEMRQRLREIQQRMIAKARFRSSCSMEGKGIKTIPAEWCESFEGSMLYSHKPSPDKSDKSSNARKSSTRSQSGVVGGKTISKMEEVILGDRCFLCPGCGNAYKAQSNLSFHKSRCEMIKHCSDKFTRKRLTRDDMVDCFCGTDDDGGNMVQCDHCRGWLHLECLGLGGEDLDDEYYCPRCVSSYDPTQPEDKKGKKIVNFGSRKEHQDEIKEVIELIRKKRREMRSVIRKNKRKSMEEEENPYKHKEPPVIHPGNWLNKIERVSTNKSSSFKESNFFNKYREFFMTDKDDISEQETLNQSVNSNDSHTKNNRNTDKKKAFHSYHHSINNSSLITKSKESELEHVKYDDDTESEQDFMNNFIYKAENPRNFNAINEEADNHWESEFEEINEHIQTNNFYAPVLHQQASFNSELNLVQAERHSPVTILPLNQTEGKKHKNQMSLRIETPPSKIRKLDNNINNNETTIKIDPWVNENRLLHADNLMIPIIPQDSSSQLIWDHQDISPISEASFNLNDINLYSPLESPPSLFFGDENITSPEGSAFTVTTPRTTTQHPEIMFTQYFELDNCFDDTPKGITELNKSSANSDELTTWDTTDGEPPKQAPARWTGLPAWHPPIKEFNLEKDEAFTIFAVVTLGISSYYSLRWTSPTSSYSLSKPTTILTNSYFYKGGAAFPTTLFDQLIAYYIFGTFVAAVVVLIFEVGKIWSIFGSLHNMFEIAIMLVLHGGGKVKSNLGYFGSMAFYVVLTNILSVLLDWPYDGIWFKFQGLCSDWALVIQFTRLYYVTKKNLRDNALPTTLPTEEQEEILLPSSVELNTDEDYRFYPNIVDHPRPLILLIIASFIHLVGNLANSIWVDDRYS